jgi:hypothetical protein
VRLARAWLTQCSETHEMCGRPASDFVPTRLIYVGFLGGTSRISLYFTEAHDWNLRYCTLSHCWGGSEDILKLTTANIHDMQENIAASDLPRTFQEAIVTARSLGVSYIWIDPR